MEKKIVRIACAFIAGSEFECKLEAGYGCLELRDSQTNTLYISVPRQTLNVIWRVSIILSELNFAFRKANHLASQWQMHIS